MLDSKGGLVLRIAILLFGRLVIFRSRQLLMLKNPLAVFHWVEGGGEAINMKGCQKKNNNKKSLEKWKRSKWQHIVRRKGKKKEPFPTHHSLSEALHCDDYVNKRMYSAKVLGASAAARRTLSGRRDDAGATGRPNTKGGGLR